MPVQLFCVYRPKVFRSYQIMGTSPPNVMARSALTNESSCSMAVATIKRSAGSAWGHFKPTHRAAIAGVIGRIDVDSLARESHSSMETVMGTLPLSMSMAASQSDMSAMACADAISRLNRAAALPNRGEANVAQIQAWVSQRYFTGSRARQLRWHRCPRASERPRCPNRRRLRRIRLRDFPLETCRFARVP